MNYSKEELDYINSLHHDKILNLCRTKALSPYFVNNAVIREWLKNGSQYQLEHYLGYGEYIKWSS